MGLSKQAKISLLAGLIVALVLVIIDPKQPLWRVVILGAIAVCLVIFAKELGWVNQRQLQLSITQGACVSETRSSVRLAIVILVFCCIVALFGIVTWPRKVHQLAMIPLIPAGLPPSKTGVVTTNLNPKLPVALAVAPSTARAIPPKPKHRPRVAPSAQVLNSPDPYIGFSNQTVGQWAVQEADRIEAMGNQCQTDVVQAIQRQRRGLTPHLPDAPGPEFVQVMFRQQFDSAVKPALIKLHDSLVLRLGPPSLDAEEEQDYQDIADFSEIPQRSAVLCMDLQAYSGELRSMGQAVTNLH